MKGEKELQMTKDFLDTINIKLLLEKNHGVRVSKIMNIIENMTKEDWYILGNASVFEGSVFNWMNEYDFMEYVTNRYNSQYLFDEVSYFVIR